MNQPVPAPQRKKPGFGSQIKKDLKIDMTPMVDLGFLLISFFVITTELSEPKAMDLIVPRKGPDMPIKYSTAVTFLPVSGNKLYYYFGDGRDAIAQNRVFEVSHYMKDVGNIILERKRFLLDLGLKPDELFVMIKPGTRSNYKIVVDLLDEMVIHGVSRYAILEQEALETEFLNKQE
jgi:biopolymer transport protein ExbD